MTDEKCGKADESFARHLRKAHLTRPTPAIPSQFNAGVMRAVRQEAEQGARWPAWFQLAVWRAATASTAAAIVAVLTFSVSMRSVSLSDTDEASWFDDATSMLAFDQEFMTAEDIEQL